MVLNCLVSITRGLTVFVMVHCFENDASVCSVYFKSFHCELLGYVWMFNGDWK